MESRGGGDEVSGHRAVLAVWIGSRLVDGKALLHSLLHRTSVARAAVKVDVGGPLGEQIQCQRDYEFWKQNAEITYGTRKTV